MKSHVPELLLPVGNLDMCYAAIHNGADAIYVGMPGFNARGRSKDHDLTELKEMIELCHLYGVKVNLAFNIVIFEDELSEVTKLLARVLELKPDTFIVQDLGLVRLIKHMAPYQVIHASTQMTVTNHDAINFLGELGIKRFVLGRENSLKEIELIAKNTDRELEVFVHGALCVAYSGQCFTSESIGGRSANRGQCAQSCRLSYDLLVDGVKKNLVDRDYLVSPQDLCGTAEIPDLLSAGVKSFKVEGRLKGPEYVAAAAMSYRPLLDGKKINEAENKKLLSATYSRGLFSGWLHGVDHQKLVEGTYNEHRGMLVGEISKINTKSVVVKLNEAGELKNGDGILFSYLDHNLKKKELGGRIFKTTKIKNDLVEIELGREVKISKDITNARVFKTNDPEIDKFLNSTLTDKNKKKKIKITAIIKFYKDHFLEVEFSDGENSVSAKSEAPLVVSDKKFSSISDNVKGIVEELQALSASVYSLDLADVSIQFGSEFLWIHQREVKSIRRELIEKLNALRVAKTVDGFEAMLDRKSIDQVLSWIGSQKKTSQKMAAKLNIVLRDKEQCAEFVLAIQTGKIKETAQIGFVILDFEYGKDYSECLTHLRLAGVKVAIATNRILKPFEYHHLKVLHRLNPDAILVRNLGAFHYLKKSLEYAGEFLGDFSLNITNHLSFNFLKSQGFHSLCLSYDLNAKRVQELLLNIETQYAEITVHQYMPSFHMEHCVFAAFLSKGSSYKDCGKPCEHHRVELVDQFGNHHHIRADQECRNTMFNATSQSALGHYEGWNELGLANIRFEAMYETGSELIQKIEGILGLIRGEVKSADLINKLNLFEKYGLSDLHLARIQEYSDRKKV